MTRLQMTYFLWIRAMKQGSMFWGGLCALSYFYMVASVW
jgi:dolichyl-diphosphooligosaccharide--protein glycosyltransferase